MRIDLTAEQQDYIDRAVTEGRLPSADAALREALALWVERERQRDEVPTAVEGEAALASGDGTEITEESMRQPAQDIGRRGRERHAAARRSKP
ncbi:MAG TPA: hypothetical protein VFA12_02735 [Stellaceae bacterium]|nr:hypothetical protein [Stellaceae bacterium]